MRRRTAESDAVAADAEGPPLLGDGLGHAEHAHLGRRVVDLTRVAMDAASGRNLRTHTSVSSAAPGHAHTRQRTLMMARFSGWRPSSISFLEASRR